MFLITELMTKKMEIWGNLAMPSEEGTLLETVNGETNGDAQPCT